MTASLYRGTPESAPIWWANATFFCAMHVLGYLGVIYVSPWRSLRTETLVLTILGYQLSMFGITIGYHRLWSHRAFAARLPLRVFLAVLGSLGFQGSIKWWVLRHRLHHRFTDDPTHDPYCATKGLLFSHLGWIFFKPRYPKMSMIEKEDLDSDIVVVLQHRYYIYIAVFVGLLCPPAIALFWGDPVGGFIWGGIVARIITWHCTFMINSFAHWDGLQPYSDEMSARENLILALLTSGEGNHNYHHAFPYDFRSGPLYLSWDPSKWVIWLLHEFTPLIPHLRRAPDTDVLKARAYMLDVHSTEARRSDLKKQAALRQEADLLRGVISTNATNAASLAETLWGPEELDAFVAKGGKAILIDGWLVDVTSYLDNHPGGSEVISRFVARHRPSMIPSKDEDERAKPPYSTLHDASSAFHGGMNNHSRTAKQNLEPLKLARWHSSSLFPRRNLITMTQSEHKNPERVQVRHTDGTPGQIVTWTDWWSIRQGPALQLDSSF